LIVKTKFIMDEENHALTTQNMKLEDYNSNAVEKINEFRTLA